MVVSFDFSGFFKLFSCGNSEGDYVTLGHKEQIDLEIVMDYVIKKFFIKK